MQKGQLISEKGEYAEGEGPKSVKLTTICERSGNQRHFKVRFHRRDVYVELGALIKRLQDQQSASKHPR